MNFGEVNTQMGHHDCVFSGDRAGEMCGTGSADGGARLSRGTSGCECSWPF